MTKAIGMLFCMMTFESQPLSAELFSAAIDSSRAIGVRPDGSDWSSSNYTYTDDIRVGGPTYYSGDFTLERGFINFQIRIPSTAPGTIINQATLTVNLTGKDGAGIDSSDTVSLWVSYDRNSTYLSSGEPDFSGGTGANYTTTWTDTGIDVCNGATANGAIELDISSVIRNILDARTEFAAFQLRIDNDLTAIPPGSALTRFNFSSNPTLEMDVTIKPEQNLLRFNIGSNVAPVVSVQAVGLKETDVGDGIYGGFSAVMDAFAYNSDPAVRASLRNSFHNTFSNDVASIISHPASLIERNPSLGIANLQTPWDFDQPAYLAWLTNNTAKTDYFSPVDRRNNNYKGTLANPWLTTNLISQQTLKETFGQVCVANSNIVHIVSDNRYNPGRWIGQTSHQIAHHEQPTIYTTFYAEPGAFELTQPILSNACNGVFDKKIMVDYDIEIHVTDYSDQYSEYTVYDTFPNQDPFASDYLPGTIIAKHEAYANGETNYNGEIFSAPLQAQTTHGLEYRIVPAYYNVSLSICFRSRDGSWRTSSFTLADMGISGTYAWPYPDANGFGYLPTTNSVLNQFVTEGRNKGYSSWARFPINVMNRPSFYGIEPSSWPVVSGCLYQDMSSTGGTYRAEGTFDFAKYYRLARLNDFLPGQSGYWNEWLGFEVPGEYYNPDEEHGFEFAAVLVENHGMQKIDVMIHSLRVWVENHAKLAHRYTFINNITDVEGSMNGTATANAAYTEAPQYSTDIPSGTVSGAPDKSLQVGMNTEMKKSGFALSSSVIAKPQGTICFWTKADKLDSTDYIFFNGPAASGLYLKGAGTTSILLGAGGSASTAVTMSTNTWHHIGVTWDNEENNAQLYLDGTLVRTIAGYSNDMNPTLVNICGFNLNDTSDNLSNQFKGYLYDLQFYETVLTDSKIQSLYSNPGNCEY